MNEDMLKISYQDLLRDPDLIDRVQWVRTPAWLGSGVPAPLVTHDARLPAEARRETVLGQDVLVESDVHGAD